MSKAIDYSVLDPQIIALRQSGKSYDRIGVALGMSGQTVRNRAIALDLPEPIVIRKKYRNSTFIPDLDELEILAKMLTIVRGVKRKTRETSKVVISELLTLANQGKLDIKNVAL